MITVLVCGGRNFAGTELVKRTLDRIFRDNPQMRIIHGACGDDVDEPKGCEVYKGADGLAHSWSIANRVPATVYPAAWIRLGRAAGPRRNEMMIRDDRPDLVIAFPGDAGTDSAIRYAQKYNVPVLRIID